MITNFDWPDYGWVELEIEGKEQSIWLLVWHPNEATGLIADFRERRNGHGGNAPEAPITRPRTSTSRVRADQAEPPVQPATLAETATPSPQSRAVDLGDFWGAGEEEAESEPTRPPEGVGNQPSRTPRRRPQPRRR
ncbi:hypothetical protein HGA91_00800 [candidate division WWE3 bacterium]|nr:hypothetical protein [candidate division WWE3 bacterium]